MISPGVMALVVRLGGGISARSGHRWVAIVGLGVQGSVMLIFSLLSAGTASWVVFLTLAYFGVGTGLMLAPLHDAALRDVASRQAGMAAGLYSMVFFLGSVVGTALAGVLLQAFMEQTMPTIVAYQRAFLAFVVFSVAGIIVAMGLQQRASSAAIDVAPPG